MLRFRRRRSLPKFVAVGASVQNKFSQERALYNRANFKLNHADALAVSRGLLAAEQIALSG
jgi:putative transposase